MSDNDADNVFDEQKLLRMKGEILQLEQNNLNTGEKNRDEMVERIKRTIISIADKAY